MNSFIFYKTISSPIPMPKSGQHRVPVDEVPFQLECSGSYRRDAFLNIDFQAFKVRQEANQKREVDIQVQFDAWCEKILDLKPLSSEYYSIHHKSKLFAQFKSVCMNSEKLRALELKASNKYIKIHLESIPEEPSEKQACTEKVFSSVPQAALPLPVPPHLVDRNAGEKASSVESSEEQDVDIFDDFEDGFF